VREQVLGGIKYKNLINGTTGERLRDIDTVMKLGTNSRGR